MTRLERLCTSSSSACCLCDHELSIQDLEEFRGAADEQIQDLVYCPACMKEHLILCRECSGRYTVEGWCGECVAREYALAV